MRMDIGQMMHQMWAGGNNKCQERQHNTKRPHIPPHPARREGATEEGQAIGAYL
jgi:hypothetical protein